MKEIKHSQLNKKTNFGKDRLEGALAVANIANELTPRSMSHLMGDITLAKLNLIKGKPRKNPNAGECNCITEIENKLKAHHNSEIDLGLKLAVTSDLSTMGAELPPLYYKYRVGKKWKQSYVHFSYCPFCGRRKNG